MLHSFFTYTPPPLTSKIIEKVVDSLLESYITANNMYYPLQSAYKEIHSTETALVKVTNYILCAVVNKKLVMLFLVDLSAAFDTVDKKILLHTLEYEFGIIGSVIARIKSYLWGRYQTVHINGASSTKRSLSCGVTQGSVLGPKHFKMYTLAWQIYPNVMEYPTTFMLMMASSI